MSDLRLAVDDGPIALTEPEAGKRMGFSREAMRRWRRNGTGPKYVRVGSTQGAVRYLLTDLIAWLESQRVGSRAEELAARGSDA